MKHCILVCIILCCSKFKYTNSQECNTTSRNSVNLIEVFKIQGYKVGRINICDGESWRAVCGDDWGMNDARVVCQELGFLTQGAQAYSDLCTLNGSVAQCMRAETEAGQSPCEYEELRTCQQCAGVVCATHSSIPQVNSTTPQPACQSTGVARQNCTKCRESCPPDETLLTPPTTPIPKTISHSSETSSPTITTAPQHSTEADAITPDATCCGDTNQNSTENDTISSSTTTCPPCNCNCITTDDIETTSQAATTVTTPPDATTRTTTPSTSRTPATHITNLTTPTPGATTTTPSTSRTPATHTTNLTTPTPGATTTTPSTSRTPATHTTNLTTPTPGATTTTPSTSRTPATHTTNLTTPTPGATTTKTTTVSTTRATLAIPRTNSTNPTTLTSPITTTPCTTATTQAATNTTAAAATTRTTQVQTPEDSDQESRVSCSAGNTALGVVIILLLLILVGVVIGWVWSFRRMQASRKRIATNTTQENLYAQTTSSQALVNYSSVGPQDTPLSEASPQREEERVYHVLEQPLEQKEERIYHVLEQPQEQKEERIYHVLEPPGREGEGQEEEEEEGVYHMLGEAREGQEEEGSL